MENLIAIVNDLRAYKTEKEWFEFKENWFEPKELGEYISACFETSRSEGSFFFVPHFEVVIR